MQLLVGGVLGSGLTGVCSPKIWRRPVKYPFYIGYFVDIFENTHLFRDAATPLLSPLFVLYVALYRIIASILRVGVAYNFGCRVVPIVYKLVAYKK